MPQFKIFVIFSFFGILFLFALLFINIRKIVMFFTPDFILFNNFLSFPMICWVNTIDIFKRKNDIMVEVIKNFRKVGKIRKVGWSGAALQSGNFYRGDRCNYSPCYDRQQAVKILLKGANPQLLSGAPFLLRKTPWKLGESLFKLFSLKD